MNITYILSYLQTPWVQSSILFVIFYLILRVFRTIIVARLEHLSAKTRFSWDDVMIKAIKKIDWPVYLVVPLYASAQFLRLSDNIYKTIRAVTLVIIAYYTVQFLQVIISKTIKDFITKKEQGHEGSKKTISIFLEITAKSMIWVLATVMVLQNLGYNVTALLGGLGVAGIAVGFALQNVLADVFAFFSLYFDRPFEVGDFIVVGEDSGTVKKIGIKSTRVKTLAGQELIVSNKELTENRVQNFKKMKTRRIVFEFGVTYDTPVNKLKKINTIMEDIIKNIENVELSRVHFKSLNKSSLDYEVVYVIQSSDYTEYMDIQQDINLQVIDKFNKAKIEFAYPTRTVILNK